MNKRNTIIATLIILVFIIAFAARGEIVSFINQIQTKNQASTAAEVENPFIYNFSQSGVVEEAETMDLSSSPYWWLNSGGLLIIKDGVGQTVQGQLAKTNKWRTLYSKNNPSDTDNGFHPQNIFRLLTRSKWQNFEQEAYFKITKNNASASENRDVSNALLLFNHYVDSDNLYYAGVRVDGHAIIKKKQKGKYTALAEKPIFASSTYDRASNPTLLPQSTWIGIKTAVKDNPDGSVNIKLFMDNGKTGKWTQIAEATDDGKTNGPAITDKAYAGIRLDFMDVLIDDYRIEEL